jgi:hypothetical protein
MAMKKKSLIGAGTAKAKEADSRSGKKPEQPEPSAAAKRLAVAKQATAKLSRAKLTTLRRLS